MRLNNYIECNNCFKLVKNNNSICPFCGESLNVVDDNFESTIEKNNSGEKLYHIAFWLFIISFTLPGLILILLGTSSPGFYGGILTNGITTIFSILFIFAFAFSQGGILLFLISLILAIVGRIKHKHNNNFAKLLFVEIVFIVIFGIMYFLFVSSLSSIPIF